MPKKIKYSEPVGYFPKEIREKYFKSTEAKPKKAAKKKKSK